MDDTYTEHTLGIADFADLFGTDPSLIPNSCKEKIASLPFRYRNLSKEELDSLLLQIFKAVHSEPLSSSGESRKDDWEAGWGENLKEFKEKEFDPSVLEPKYFKRDEPIRLRGEYVKPLSNNFYSHYTGVFREWLATRWFKDIPAIAEFGCGSGSHIAAMAELFPEKEIIGLDWASASQKILSLLAEKQSMKVHGKKFDFFKPNKEIILPFDCGVLTYGALEQVGNRFKPFIDYLLEQKIGICVHVEGFLEMYDQDDLMDYLAIEYHKKRNYLSGFVPYLQMLETMGKIEILDIHHHRAGVLFNDTYSYLAWKPINGA